MSKCTNHSTLATIPGNYLHQESCERFETKGQGLVNKVTIPVKNVNCWVPLQVPSETVVSSSLACLDWPQIAPMPVQVQNKKVFTWIFPKVDLEGQPHHLPHVKD